MSLPKEVHQSWLSFLIIISSIFSISMASCNPDLQTNKPKLALPNKKTKTTPHNNSLSLKIEPMNLLSFLIIISSIFSISMASCNPDHDADELATQLNHDECGAELGEFSSFLSLDPPSRNGQSSDTSSSAIVDHDSSASTSFFDCEQRGDQPPITTVAAAQDQCLESGASDNEDGEELLKRGQASQQDSTGRMETRTRALDMGWTFVGLTFQALLCLAIFHFLASFRALDLDWAFLRLAFQALLCLAISYFQAPFRALDLGWTFLGLAFQALLCLAIFHFQAPSTPTSTSTSTLSSFSMWFYLIGAAMLMIAMPLRNAYPTAARIGEQIGTFSVAFGFLMMTGILLPHRLNCCVLPVAGELLFLGFVFALANMRQRRYYLHFGRGLVFLLFRSCLGCT